MTHTRESKCISAKNPIVCSNDLLTLQLCLQKKSHTKFSPKSMRFRNTDNIVYDETVIQMQIYPPFYWSMRSKRFDNRLQVVKIIIE